MPKLKPFTPIYQHVVPYKGHFTATFPTAQHVELAFHDGATTKLNLELSRTNVQGMIDFLVTLRDQRWPKD